MAVSAALLTSGTSTTDGSSFTTASVTPAANSLLLVFVVNAVTGGADATLSGLSATWTRRVNQAASSSTKLSVHSAQLGATPGSGALTITTAPATGSIVWHVVQVTGHDTASPIVQTPAASGASSTAASLTYAAAGGVDNRLLYACGVAGSVTQTPRTNWSELQDQTVATPSCSLETQWRSDATETTGSSTLSVANLWATAGVEVAAAASGVTVAPDGLVVPAAVGAPAAGWSGSVAPDGVSAPVLVGAPGSGWVADSAPAGVPVAVAVGAPSAAWSGDAAGDGLAVPVVLGDPAVGWLSAVAPLGLLVPVDLGGPGVSSPGAVVVRPDGGVVARPAAGVAVRPSTGMVTRPTGVVARPNTGVVSRP